MKWSILSLFLTYFKDGKR